MAYTQFGRGTSGILQRVRELCNFARRYPFADLMAARTGSSQMGDAIELLIVACDAFMLLDNNPWETDKVDPSTSPEDEVV